ncbi:MAG: V-type ATP synthase subunit K [Candidatus Thorarchaeota archaeon]|nr:MAG: V-type ATP synthase subunit K [Candidatus Thorarchaeota archaeon]
MLQAISDAGLAIMGLAIGAGLALGLAGIGAGLGMGTASAAALGAITEKPETFGKSILYVVFIEAVAIYGFVIAFLLIGLISTVLA